MSMDDSITLGTVIEATKADPGLIAQISEGALRVLSRERGSLSAGDIEGVLTLILPDLKLAYVEIALAKLRSARLVRCRFRYENGNVQSYWTARPRGRDHAGFKVSLAELLLDDLAATLAL